jgi:DNA-directed RNA polymerase specialized sigma24 family protein
MLDREDMLRRFYRRIDPAKSVDPEDSELAFQLHLSRLNDPEIVEKLVNRYTDAVYKLVFVTLYYQKMDDPPKDQVLYIIKEIYGYAIKHVEQFHGNESVLNWLFAITYKFSGKKNRRLWVKIYPFRRIQWKKGEYTTDAPNPVGKHKLDWFSPSQWSIFTLRYLFDLSVHDISMILNLHRSKVHSSLKIIRKQQGMSSNTSHGGEIEAYADGLLDRKYR